MAISPPSSGFLLPIFPALTAGFILQINAENYATRALLRTSRATALAAARSRNFSALLFIHGFEK